MASLHEGSGHRAAARQIAAGSALLALLSAGAASAAERAHLAIDANTGATLIAEAADDERYPASLAKMMTIYLAFELLEAGTVTYDTPIPISAEAAAQPPSKAGLEAGETIRLGDALKVLITKSANDVAHAIGEYIAGSEEAFARRMTARARQLGMTRTTFRNAHGLPDGRQVTTARDMATLALRLQDDFPRQYRLFATRVFTFQGNTYRTHNTLLGRFAGMDGIKTGYTRASGFNLVSSVRRDGRHVIGVVMGGRSATARNATMVSLLNRALERASTERTRPGRPQLVARPSEILRPALAAHAGADDRPRRPSPPREAAGPGREPVGVWQTTGAAARPSQRPASAGGERAAPPSSGQAARIEVARVRSSPLPGGSGQGVVADADGAPAAAPATSPWAPGRPPSTLADQARALAGPPGNAPEAARPQTAGIAAGGSMHLQVGAYRTAAEASRQLDAVQAQASSLLAGLQPLTVPTTLNGQTFFRARFAGFDAGSARAVCTELRRLSIDCFVARAE